MVNGKTWTSGYIVPRVGFGVNGKTWTSGFIATNIAKNAVGITEEVLKNSRNALGMQADVFAQKALKAIHQRQKNVYIGGAKEKLAMLLKRLTPGLFDRFIKNQKVT